MIKGQQYDIVYDKNGNMLYDPELKDNENIPWGISIDDYMKTEVLPFAPETLVDESVLDSGPLQDGQIGVVGTNISFNKYFFKYEMPREPKIIASEILSLEKGLEAFMDGFLK